MRSRGESIGESLIGDTRSGRGLWIGGLCGVLVASVFSGPASSVFLSVGLEYEEEEEERRSLDAMGSLRALWSVTGLRVSLPPFWWFCFFVLDTRSHYVAILLLLTFQVLGFQTGNCLACFSVCGVPSVAFPSADR